MCILFSSCLTLILYLLPSVKAQCFVSCEGPDDLVCGYDMLSKNYVMFRNRCRMAAYVDCYKTDFIQTPLKYCVQSHSLKYRRNFEESCPVFCPQHYSPVCAASKVKAYIYRTFMNGCYLDMINCRGFDDEAGYVEVPLSFCQKHHMMNIFGQKLIVTNTKTHDPI